MVLRSGFLVVALGLGLAGPVPLRAETVQAPRGGAEVSLSEALQIGAVIEVLREEGLAGAADIASGFGTGQGGAGWQASVEAIYDPVRMQQVFDDVLTARLAGAPEETALAIAFFTSDLGTRALKLEVEARQALLDPDTEAAARFHWEDMVAAHDPRVTALSRFAEINDLVDSNVSGALNSNLAFYQGLASAGGPLDELSEADILGMVAADEEATRASTTEWLFPFLALAYQPLSDEELQAYTDFSDSPAGRRVNAAMFEAFDRLFVQISRELGQAAGREMAGQDI